MGGNFFSNEGLKDSFLANKKMHSTTFLCPSPSDGNKEVEFMYSSQSEEQGKVMYITGKKIFQQSHLVTQLSILTEISPTSCTQRVFMRGHIVDIYLQDLTFPQYVGTASSIRMNKNSKPKESGQCESAVCTKTVKRASVPSPHSMK